MNTKTIVDPDSDASHEHERAFQIAFSAARKARSGLIKTSTHRAISARKVTPYMLAQAVILPLILCGLLFWSKPLLLDFWRNCILFWSAGIAFPHNASTAIVESGQFSLRLSTELGNAPMPSRTTLVVTTLVTLIALALSFGMNKANFPLKYPLRIVCVVQLFTVIYFWLSPSSFPYSIARHSEELMTIGFVVMLSTPVMLAMGYYILNQSLLNKLFNTLIILLFLAIMIPHQVLAQAMIMQHLSVLFMPVLYICFGAVFDALVFVALYSWIVSNTSADATA